MSKSERAKLEREGYIIGIDEPAPALITINTIVAGLGATAGLNLSLSLTGKVQPVDQIYDASSALLIENASPTSSASDCIAGLTSGLPSTPS